MDVRVRISGKGYEIDYEGSEEFLTGKMPTLVQQLSELALAGPSASSETVTNDGPDDQPPDQSSKQTSHTLTTRTIASRLKLTGGADLVMAACAHLKIVMNQENFTQKDILSDMQTASGIYKQTNHGSNLTKNIGRLIQSGKLHEVRKGVYVLAHEEEEKLRAELGFDKSLS
jgi:hypothetical protein